jgi:predicted nucleic acid-binding protein
VVIVDSDIIITAYRQKGAPERVELTRLLESGEAATVGLVLAEVLRGARSDSEFREMSEELLSMRYLDGGQDAWLVAARILFDLKREGQIIPLGDAIIAAEAMLSESAVYGHDEHFRRVPGLRIHQGQSPS